MPTTLERPVRDRQHLTAEELQQEAIDAAKRSEKSQREIARGIEQSEPVVSKALNKKYGSRYASVQREIIAFLTEFEVSDTPTYEVRRKDRPAV